MANSTITSADVMLIGYENQENLGLRSMIAVLQQRGYRALLQPFTPGNQVRILEAIMECKPRIVGFSLIFQFNLHEFADLMAYLRQAGVTSHFTAGGHFPTIRPGYVLKSIAELDTVIRHEGELTILELLESLNKPESWSSIQGLAFRRGDQISLNPPRTLIADLDSLPWIHRDAPRTVGTGVHTASMLASRGCLFNCSFCSIRQFYGTTSGSLRRVRTPADVVNEMRWLFEHQEVRFFVFQDDDFAARAPNQRRWLAEFLRMLRRSGLVENIGWKISCRVDDLEDDILQELTQHGLACIYLGVEAGNPVSLQTLNKHVTVEQNLAAIELLKHHNVMFSIGFMLFDPSSTVKTIKENITFLQQVSLDGSYPVNFCKMLPYAGTPIEDQLIREGRLKGSIAEPDYDFIDPCLDWYAFLVKRIFRHRNFDQLGLASLLATAQFNQLLVRKFTPELAGPDYEQSIKEYIYRDNVLVLDTLSSLLDLVIDQSMDKMLGDQAALVKLAESVWKAEAQIQTEFSDWLLRYDPQLLRVFTTQSIQAIEAARV